MVEELRCHEFHQDSWSELLDFPYLAAESLKSKQKTLGTLHTLRGCSDYHKDGRDNALIRNSEKNRALAFQAVMARFVLN